MAKALDVILVIHADHEQNASTSTVRIAGSSQASFFVARMAASPLAKPLRRSS